MSIWDQMLSGVSLLMKSALMSWCMRAISNDFDCDGACEDWLLTCPCMICKFDTSSADGLIWLLFGTFVFTPIVSVFPEENDIALNAGVCGASVGVFCINEGGSCSSDKWSLCRE